MSYIHGADISAAEVEEEIARWTPERFAGFCNAIALAQATDGGRRQPIPAFTERVNVADNGIDAEWEREFTADELGPAPGGHLRVGSNVLQYKKRDAGSGNRNKIIAALVTDIRGAAATIELHTGKKLASYALWTNLHLTLAQAEKLRASILRGLANASTQELLVTVVGASTLAALAQKFPHLRSAFFATSAFRDWGRSFETHQMQSTQIGDAGALARLTGRDGSLKEFRRLIDNPSVRAIVVAGPHMMGKTRLVLEGTRHRDVDTVESLDPAGVTADGLLRLHKAGRETIVLLQDLATDTTERILREVVALDGAIKAVVTLPTQEGGPIPNFGLDDRVKVLPLAALAEQDARSLYTSMLSKDRVDYAVESWILEQAGGIPGVLIAAARLGNRIRPEAGTFVDQVGAAFEAKLRRLLPDASVHETMDVASLMTQVRTEGDNDAELLALCSPFGLAPHVFRAAIERLEETSYVRQRGSFIETVPPILANRLAGRTVKGRPAEVMAAFRALEASGRRRLLRRLAQVREDCANRFWSALFEPGGLMGSFAGVSDNIDLFRAVAPAAVVRAADLVHEGLKSLPSQRRRELRGEARRGLVSSLQEMMTATATSERAFRSLGLLAEAENEDFSNNATGVFCHGAYPINTQVPLPLDCRLAVLREFLSPERDEAAAAVALQAASSAVNSGRSILLTPSRGPRPSGGFPAGMTWGDVQAYRRNLLDIISAAVDDARPQVRKKAKAVWATAAEHLAYDARENAERAVAAIEQIVDRIVSGDREFSVSNVVDVIMICYRNLADMPEDRHPAGANELAVTLAGLLRKLRTGSYEVRLRWRLGNSWRDLDDEQDAETAKPEDPFAAKDRAVSDLAKEACDAPARLTSELVEWSVSDEANSSRLFWLRLGQYDAKGLWKETVLALAKREDTWQATVDYLQGVSGRDLAATRSLFEHLQADQDLHPHVMPYASAISEGADAAAARTAHLVRQGCVPPLFAARFAGSPGFQDKVSSSRFAGLLQAVVGDSFDSPGLVVHALAFWFHNHPPAHATDPVVEFAWQCLETGLPTGKVDDGYDTGEIAAGLVGVDPDRGFRLLAAAAARSIEDVRNPASATYNRWSPFHYVGPHQPCWEAFRKLDRDRALTVVLDRIVLAGKDAFALVFQLKNLVRMPEDAGFLRAYAAASDAKAEVVAQVINRQDQGFWELACEIFERNPDDEALKGRLAAAIGNLGSGSFGVGADQYADAATDIERVCVTLKEAFPRTERWLGELAVGYRRAEREERRREEDRSIND
jgi:hypothetical protein